MTTSNQDVLWSADLLQSRHGENAVAEARRLVSQLQQAGDPEGADLWLRVIIVLQSLLQGGTGALS